MKMSNVTPEVKRQTYDEIVSEINNISEGVKRLLDSRLSRRAIVVLIHDSVPSRGYNSKPTRRQIEDVLDTAANLKNIYLKKLKDSEK